MQHEHSERALDYPVRKDNVTNWGSTVHRGCRRQPMRRGLLMEETCLVLASRA